MIGSIGDLLFDHFFIMIGAAVCVILLVLLLRTLARALFGLQHVQFAPLEPSTAVDIAKDPRLKRVVLVDYSWDELRALSTHLKAEGCFEFFDLSLRRGELDTNWDQTCSRWIFVGLESILMNQELRCKCLDMLEKLSSDDNKHIYFFSEVSPLARLRQARAREKEEARRKEEGDNSQSSQAARESFRWSNLFADFTTFYGQTPDVPNTGAWSKEEEKDFVDEILNREFGRIPSTKVHQQREAARRRAQETGLIEPEAPAEGQARLEAGRAQPGTGLVGEAPSPAAAEPKAAHRAELAVPREAVIAYLANFLGDYYQRQWLKSTTEEHLAMHHLAHGRYINADNFIVLDNLLQRGLVRRDPDFQLMNESFAHWVRMLNLPDWFEDFRMRAERGGTWHYMRVPLLLAIVSSVTLLAYLDRGGSGSLVTLLPAVAAGVPLLLTQFAQQRQNLSS